MKKIYPVIYILLSSVTVLVMLVTSFELLNEKYMPAFLIAQKFVLPVILSILGVMYIFFFEPEALNVRSVRVGFIAAHIIILGLFVLYVVLLDRSKIPELTFLLFLCQIAAIIGMTAVFFFPPKKI